MWWGHGALVPWVCRDLGCAAHQGLDSKDGGVHPGGWTSGSLGVGLARVSTGRCALSVICCPARGEPHQKGERPAGLAL